MDHRFKIDLRGMIDLLSNHLYSDDDVFVRELLQNGVDALTARAAVMGGSAEADARAIRVTAVNPGELTFEDAGVGLDEGEVHTFLSTIGESSKRIGDAPGGRDYLGQFGIGLLSCFVVSDEIEVHTRSAKTPDAPVLRWVGRADGTYELGSGAATMPTMEPGTIVRLRAKAGKEEWFDAGVLRRRLAHYGSLLPHVIELVTPTGTERIDASPPWRDERIAGAARRAAILSYGNETFGTEFLDFIELRSEAGGVDGVAYVMRSASATGGRRADQVYLKGMLLSVRAENLLPDWAFFVRAIVDVRGLRPLASREAFVEDDALVAARESLGDCIKSYLRTMAREDSERLAALLSLHHRPIKQLAAEDDEFLMLVAPWLPFETSAGWMSLEQYLSDHPSILYAATVDAFRQIAPLVQAEGRCVINAGYSHDGLILERFAGFSEMNIEPLDARALADGFATLELDEREQVFDLLRTADIVLQRFKCRAEAKRFAPAALPALFSADQSAIFVRSIEQTKEKTDELWGAVLDDLAAGRGKAPYAQFTLNYDNPMIRRLAAVDDPELLRRLIEVLYVQTLLLGHHPLDAQEMLLVSESLSGLILWSLEQGPGRMLQ